MGILKNFYNNVINPKIDKETLLGIEKYSMENAKKFIEVKISEITNNAMNERGLTTQEAISRRNRIKKLTEALETAPVGDIFAKQYVKDFINDFLTNKAYGYCVNEKNINYILNFDHEQSLSLRNKFDILLYKYKREYEYNALEEIIKKHKLAEEMKDEEGQFYYCITKNDIEDIYSKEDVSLDYQGKLEIIVQIIYSDYIGLSVVDDIRDQYIDGVSVGVSGVPENIIVKLDKLEYYARQMSYLKLPRNYDSVWIFYKGINIHLKFLSFGSDKELRRVCEQIYLYGQPGEFSEEDGFKVNDMADQSRVVVFRPPFCETWCFWVRKFDIPDVSLEYLVSDDNSQIVIDFTDFCMKGRMVTAITGVQGAGKTTFLFAAVEKIYANLNLRLVENGFFEVHLRKKFHNRNIATVKNINDIVNEEVAIDSLKKTDGGVTLLPEVASSKAAASMVKIGRKATYFTVFCHHALSFRELIDSLVEDLLTVGLYNSEELATKRVVNLIDTNTHLEMTPEGNRYVGRMTECIPIDDRGKLLNRFTKANTFEEKNEIYMEAMIRQSEGKKLYDEKDIIIFNLETNRYEFKNKLSDERIAAIRKSLFKKDINRFDQFISEMIKSVDENGDNNE